jgi:SanA protein
MTQQRTYRQRFHDALHQGKEAGLHLATRLRQPRVLLRLVLSSLVSLLVLSALLVILADYLVSDMRKYSYQDAALIPYNKVAVVLGTSRFLSDGGRNEYFHNRIAAAADLYRQGKASFFLVSGDNATLSYNEPREMRRALIRAGIPAERIYSDYAGFRTLDSIVRANAVFGQSSYTIVSQQFHNERALYLARHFGIQAIGYNARDVDAYSGFKTRVRELMARVLCLLDVYILDKQPKFLGKPVVIG